MPAKTEKQRKYMAGCAKNPKRMKGKCPPKKVAKKYMRKRKKA